MSKIIPRFYLPIEYQKEMRIYAEGLVANDGRNIKAILQWLQGKLISQEGDTAGKPKKERTIKNYLCGFYVLDLFQADNNFYRQLKPKKTVSLSPKAEINIIPEFRLISEIKSDYLFKEKLTQLCFEYSTILKNYDIDRNLLQKNYELGNKLKPDLIRKILLEDYNYSHIGDKYKNPIGCLEIFYKDKIEITSYLNLMEFIVKNYTNYAKDNMGLVPISEIFNQLHKVSDNADEEIKKFLIKLRITNRIELRMTKTQLAKNLGIELVNIQGVEYGFLKILDYSLLS